MASTTTQKKTIPLFVSIRDVQKAIKRKSSLNISQSESLKRIMTWGKLTQKQAALFSFFVAYSIDEDSNEWQLENLSSYVDMDACEYYQYIPDLDYLLRKGFFSLKWDMKYIPNTMNATTMFVVPDSLIDLLSYNKPFKPYISQNLTNETNCLSFLFRLRRETSILEKPIYLWDLAKTFYKDDKIIKMFLNEEFGGDLVIYPMKRTLALFAILGTQLLKNQSVRLKDELVEYYGDDPFWVNRVIRSFKSERAPLIKKKIFKIDKGQLGDSISITWGDFAKKHIFKGYEDLLCCDENTKELNKIVAKDIKEKVLFYNSENQQDIERLESLLQDDNYNSIRKRLEEKGMPKGLIILLYGPPGTGKTETVMQLARKSNRDLFHVNIHEVRSCWVGESEKNTKQIFEAYKNTKTVIKPILLFNEADGIISKRSSIGSRNSSVDKMENSMQNIILEELENFDGICILTTNLVDNFDPAFDRRILFKIKLENPKLETKIKIWKNKIDSLSNDDAKQISEKFDFSGGQIENVRRKITLDEVLYGKTPNIDTVLDFCKKEKFNNEESKKIGFGS